MFIFLNFFSIICIYKIYTNLPRSKLNILQNVGELFGGVFNDFDFFRNLYELFEVKFVGFRTDVDVNSSEFREMF